MDWVRRYQPAASGETSLDTARLTLEVVRLGLEQAIMDWVRTSMSLITFGFTIYKFFQMDRRLAAGSAHLVGPRGFAIALIALGILSLVFATFQHLRGMRDLRARYGDKPPPRSLASFVSVFVSVLGVVALLLAVFGQ